MRSGYIRMITAAVVIVLMSAPAGCGQTGTLTQEGEDMKVVDISGGVSYDNIVAGRELICLAGSEKEAEEIADKYGIELVEFSLGVASFHTDEDPLSVIEKGKKDGLPELSLNGKGYADSNTGDTGNFRTDNGNIH
ncbi:MAG: hypothetical protein K6F86_05725 [Lachnospiraceae bacterium]|nr:hypothetical protein [Lachnospiraceae bacterium]